MYVSTEEYMSLSRDHAVPSDQLDAYLNRASLDIDALTYDRIVARGLDNLTPRQQTLVKQAVVDQADFTAQYGVVLANPLASYGINGVSMSWDAEKVISRSGVDTSRGVVSLLLQTGLTYRGVR